MTRLGDVLEALVDCEHKTAPIDETGDRYVVGTPAMQGNRINLAEARPVSRATYVQWTRRLTPRSGDLLLAREAPVGPVVQIPEEENVAPGQRTVLMRPKTSAASTRYLYYALAAPASQSALAEKAAGSTVAHLNVADIRAFEFAWDFPPLRNQVLIADVLGALDDKIAANRRLATAALALASAHFERHRSRNGAEPVTYEAVAEVAGGGTPSTRVPEFWGGDILWTTPTDVTALEAPYLDQTDRTITEEGFNACASALHPAGTILMTSRATIGAFALARRPVAVNQGFIVANAKNPAAQWWLFHEMQTRVGDYVAHANGATFLELSRGRFKAMELEWPTDHAAFEGFAAMVEPLHERAYQAHAESRHLANLRDTLLPHLMSGRLTVRQAETFVGEVL